MAGTIVVTPSAQANTEFKSLVLLKKMKCEEGEEMCETTFLLQSVNCTTAAIISGGCAQETEQSLTIQKLVAIQTSHPAFLIQQSLISALSCYCHFSPCHYFLPSPSHHLLAWPVCKVAPHHRQQLIPQHPLHLPCAGSLYILMPSAFIQQLMLCFT